MGSIFPKMTLSNELSTADLSKIDEEVRMYEEDPLIHDRISPAYSITMLEQGQQLLKQASSLNIPLLLLHGDKDRITSYEASKNFCKASELAQIKLIEGAFHEIHNDLEAPILYETVGQWLEEQITNP